MYHISPICQFISNSVLMNGVGHTRCFTNEARSVPVGYVWSISAKDAFRTDLTGRTLGKKTCALSVT